MKDIPHGYQEVSCYIIFDVKMEDNFRRKDQMVAGGHNTTTPSSLTYFSFLSQDSVRTALTMAVLNYLKVLLLVLCSEVGILDITQKNL